MVMVNAYQKFGKTNQILRPVVFSVEVVTEMGDKSRETNRV